MGIYDREYYRDKTRGFGWLTGAASACKTIILLNVAIFFLGKLLDIDHWLTDWFSNNSRDVLEKGQIWRLVTSAFLHSPDSIWHIVVNMLMLWFVGREMEAFYGQREFWWFYISAAVVSSLCWVTIDYSRQSFHYAVGASGAVMAVMAVYTFYNPRREVILYFIPVEMWLLLTIFVVSDGYSLMIRSREPIGFAAHLGGIAYAFAFKTFDLRLKHVGDFNFRKLKRLIPGATPKLRLVMPPDPPPKREIPTVRPAPLPPASTGPLPSPTPASGTETAPQATPTWSAKPASTPRPTSTTIISEESFEAKFDEILVKIKVQGRESLTDEEKRICEEAVVRARSRRGERIP